MSFWKRRARLTRQCLRRKITASTDILKEEGGNVPNPLHGRSRAAYAIPIAIVIVLSAVMASLARASVAGTLAAGPSTSISFSLDYLVDGLHAPFYVAQQNGCFTQGNLAVSIHPSTGSSDSVSRVASGTAQIGLSDAPTALLGIAKGYPIKVVGVLLLHSAQATETLRSSGITTPQGLENKSIGITPAGAERQEIAALFKINNVDTSKVHLVSISASAGKAILLSGQVDAVNFFPPIFAGETNKINTIPWFKYGLDTYGTVIIANTAFLAEEPAGGDDLRALRNARSSIHLRSSDSGSAGRGNGGEGQSHVLPRGARHLPHVLVRSGAPDSGTRLHDERRLEQDADGIGEIPGPDESASTEQDLLGQLPRLACGALRALERNHCDANSRVWRSYLSRAPLR